MDSAVKKVLAIMAVIIILAAATVGVLYVRNLGPETEGEPVSTEVSQTQPATEPAADTVQPADNPILMKYVEDDEQLISKDIIRVLVLRSKSETEGNFRYEVLVNDGKVTFTGWYNEDGEDVRCSDQPINASRLKDVSDIIESHIVANTIRDYINNPNAVAKGSDEEQALEITFADGRHANFGYPNGAGKALAKYFKALTAWLATLE